MDYDLKQCLDTHFPKGMPFRLIQSCMLQILAGLHFCHSQLILHRDLKPQNVLIDKTGVVKLADFGLARAFQARKTYTPEVVTLWYRAPELLLGEGEYAAAVDLWSTGCILSELTCRKPLFPGDSEIDQLFRIFRLLGTPSEQTWPGVTKLDNFQNLFPRWRPNPLQLALPQLSDVSADLLSHLICYNPPKRYSAQDAMEHPFFEGLGPVPVAPLEAYQLPQTNPLSPSGHLVHTTSAMNLDPHTAQSQKVAGGNVGGSSSGLQPSANPLQQQGNDGSSDHGSSGQGSLDAQLMPPPPVPKGSQAQPPFPPLRGAAREEEWQRQQRGGVASEPPVQPPPLQVPKDEPANAAQPATTRRGGRDAGAGAQQPFDGPVPQQMQRTDVPVQEIGRRSTRSATAAGLSQGGKEKKSSRQ